MNISIQDGFNLGWKVASAAAGITKPEAILHRYELVRHPVAKTLFEFGQTWSDLFANDRSAPRSSRPATKDTVTLVKASY